MACQLQGEAVWQGLPIAIENVRGTYRDWKDPKTGDSGRTLMLWDYGYIRGTKGVDGDAVDCYLGPSPDASWVYVIHQHKKRDDEDPLADDEFYGFDEDKCMLGFASPQEAREAYRAQYDSYGFYGGMTVMPVEEFKAKVMARRARPGMIKSAIRRRLVETLSRAITDRRAHVRRMGTKLVHVRHHDLTYHEGQGQIGRARVAAGGAERQGSLWTEQELHRLGVAWTTASARHGTATDTGILEENPPTTVIPLAGVPTDEAEKPA